jgi:Skp family chaperone for outer membrane proteins
MITMVAAACLLAGPALQAQALAQAEPAVRIGVFDPESLWKLTELGKKYNADLTQARDRLQGEIDKKSQALEDMKDKLRQQQASLSEDKITQMQKDILAKRTELDRMNEDATKEMKYQLGDVQGRFQQLLLQTVEVFGKERNFALILNKGVIDYNAASLDVTQDLIAKFNEMHKAAVAGQPAPAARKTPEKPKPSPKDGGRN